MSKFSEVFHISSGKEEFFETSSVSLITSASINEKLGARFSSDVPQSWIVHTTDEDPRDKP